MPADQLMLRRNLRRFVLRTLAAAVLIFIFGPGLIWLYSPWGQIQLVKWDIAKLSRGNDQQTLVGLAKGFPFAGYREQAAEAAAAIADPARKAEALQAVAQATAQAGDANRAAELLKRAAETAAAIADPFYKAAALQAVARVTAQAGSETKNPELLKQAAEAAAAIAVPTRKVEALGAVAQTAAKLGHWRQALDYARRNSYDEGKANALIAILQVWYGVDEKKD